MFLTFTKFLEGSRHVHSGWVDESEEENVCSLLIIGRSVLFIFSGGTVKYFCCTLPSRLQVSVVPPTCYLVVPAGMGTVVPKSTCYLVVPVPGSTCWTVLLQTCWTRYNCKPAGTIANLLVGMEKRLPGCVVRVVARLCVVRQQDVHPFNIQLS